MVVEVDVVVRMVVELVAVEVIPGPGTGGCGNGG